MTRTALSTLSSLALAAAAMAAAVPAAAQSSVTLYGRVNVTAESVDANGVKTSQLVDNASRIGFKGVEDLGGGLKAGFVLEHRFGVDTGIANPTFWAGQSEVYLSGGFGMIRLGQFTSEAYFATADWIGWHNHDTGNSADALYAFLGRSSNKIAYRTPELVPGLTAEAAISLGEGGGRVRQYDGSVYYGSGPLSLGFGYQSADDDTQFAVRGAYELGDFTLGAYVQRHDADLAGKRTIWRIAGMYTMGASEFHANYGKAGEYSKVSGSDATQWTLAYNYNLSKRTKVYAWYSSVSDDLGVSAAGGDLKSLAVGVRHNW